MLFLFLWNFRTTVISLTAIPLSLITAIIAMSYFGIGINTMTLGGLAIAIGELVDDAIIDVENVFRRLKQNAQSGRSQTPEAVIYKASSEIRNSIVFATLIIVLVFLPLLQSRRIRRPDVCSSRLCLYRFDCGLTARCPDGDSCALLLPARAVPALHQEKDSWLVAWLKARYARTLDWALGHPFQVISSSMALLVVALMVFPLMGREFLPPFNEGALNINITLPPGTSLQESNRIGRTVEEVLHRTPEVVSTTRRTGRAELDEHAAGVSMSEIEVVTRALGRPHTAVMEEVRQNLAQIPGVVSEVGQPISHRIDHLLSGTRAQIAIKLFGSDLVTLRNKGEEIRKAMETVPGVVDLMLEPQTGVPQVQINLDRRAAAALGLRADTLAETVDVAFNGEAVSQVLEDQRTYDVVVRYDDASRQSVETIASTLVDTPAGAKIPLNQVAEIRVDQGPNTINRENVQRRIIVQANVR